MEQPDETQVLPLPRGVKLEYVPLKREDQGLKHDPQFSGEFPVLEWVVFYNYGDGTLGAAYFRGKTAARDWALKEGVRNFEATGE